MDERDPDTDRAPPRIRTRSTTRRSGTRTPGPKCTPDRCVARESRWQSRRARARLERSPMNPGDDAGLAVVRQEESMSPSPIVSLGRRDQPASGLRSYYSETRYGEQRMRGTQIASHPPCRSCRRDVDRRGRAPREPGRHGWSRDFRRRKPTRSRARDRWRVPRRCAPTGSRARVPSDRRGCAQRLHSQAHEGGSVPSGRSIPRASPALRSEIVEVHFAAALGPGRS